MKIQHLETFLKTTSDTSFSPIQEEIMFTFVILMNALSCLPPQHRWIVVDKVNISTKSTRSSTGDQKNPLIATIDSAVTSVALKLADIKKEYESYIERKQIAVAQSLSFIDF